MINIKFMNKRYKIYANGNIRCLDGKDEYSEIAKLRLKDIIDEFWELYSGPENGFPVSNMAHFLPKYNIEVINYRDYEMENAKPDTVY